MARVRWIMGVAILGIVIAVAMRFTEGRDFLRIAQQLEPRWLLAALALQAGTYLAQGQLWCAVARAAEFRLPLWTAYQLSLAKLFVDQALPSAGISGTLVLARSLEDLGMPRRAVLAGVVVDSASYHAAYVSCLAAAMFIALLHHQTNPLIELVAAAFGVFASLLTVTVVALSGRAARLRTLRIAKFRPIRLALKLLADADPRLAHDPRLLLQGFLSQLAIFLLDAATLGCLIEALGTRAPLPGVFASTILSALFRTVGVLPAGLGAFEAASVLTLNMIGVDVAVALSATLLFDGLNFWLPMLPGLWVSRRVAARGRGAPQSEGP